jgi:alpha-beta hydrolase superfamily lysophospholipase
LLTLWVPAGQRESTKLGYTEAREVRDVYEWVRQKGNGEVHLFGTSMGAAAILKAAHEYKIEPASIMLECPFGSLYKTVSARFRVMNIPPFPMASLLTFWGGIQLGYWPFSHNPSEYAASVTAPTLLLFGDLDDRVLIEKTLDIYGNLNSEKKVLVRYPHAGHDVFSENRARWIQDVSAFLHQTDSSQTTLLRSNQ